MIVSYAVDADEDRPGWGHIYWRCEEETCPSAIAIPGTDQVDRFVGVIQYDNIQHGLYILGTVAVAHAALVDQKPLDEMRVESVLETREEIPA